MAKSEKYDILFKGFFEDGDLNSKLAVLLEEAEHVHFSHPEMWKRNGEFKDYAASKLALIIKDKRSRIGKFLDLNDRIVSMLIYRAVELLKSDTDLGEPL